MKKICLMMGGIAFLFCFAACNGKPDPSQDKAVEQSADAPNSLEPPRIDYNKPEHQAAKDTVLRVADYAPRMVDRVHVTKVSDNISAQDADRAYLYGKPEIRLCYTNAFVDNNELALDSTLKIALDATGKVADVSFDPAIAEPKFGQCMHDAVSRFRFPKPRDGKPATVEFSMNITHKPPVTAEEIEAGRPAPIPPAPPAPTEDGTAQ